SGKLRFERRGRAEPVGRGGEWLLTQVAAAAWQVIQTSDGAPVAVPQLDQRTALAKVSPGGGAFALIHPTEAQHLHPRLAAVRKRGISFAGQTADAGRNATLLEVADDGQSIVEGTSGHVWRITDTGRTAHPADALAATEPADRAQRGATVVSPMGRYEIR